MYWLKSCPRCRGDLQEEKDFYGVYIACMQCGYILSGDDERRLRMGLSLEREETTRTAA